MDMSEYKDGNIFDNIQKYNNQLAEKLKLRIELRNHQLLEKNGD